MLVINEYERIFNVAESKFDVKNIIMKMVDSKLSLYFLRKGVSTLKILRELVFTLKTELPPI